MFNIENTFNIDNIEYLQVLVVQGRFCQLKTNFPVIVSLYIYKLKTNTKLQEKTLARRDVNPPCTYRKMCQSPKPKFCF